MATSNTSPSGKRSTPAKRSKSSSTRNDMVFYLPPIIPALLMDVDDAPSNQLPFAATYKPLRVEFPKWLFSDPSEEDPETLTLYMEVLYDLASARTAMRVPVASKTWTAPIAENDLFVEVPTRYLRDGRYKYHYEVTLFNGDLTPSKELIINIDTTPPSLGQTPLFSFNPAVVRNTLTDAYFQNNDQQLIGALPPPRAEDIPPGFEGETLPYIGAAVGDVVMWYWSQDPAGNELVGRRELKTVDLGKPLEVSFPADFIRQSGNGMHFPRYEVQDRAGTALQRSMSVALNFEGTPVAARTPPSIKEASGNAFSSELKPVDASNGATVLIPASAVIEGAKTRVYWGAPGTAFAYETDTPVSPGSREYTIPKAFIAPHMNKVVEVYYHVQVEGEKPSQIHRTAVQWITGLPRTQSDQIQDGLLVLDTLSGGPATFTIGTWSHIATSQYISAWIEGVERGNVENAVILPIATEMEVPSEDTTITLGSLDKAILEKLAPLYQFRIHVRVSFDDKESWRVFPFVDATLVDSER
ncbi:hypothetical protein HU750_11325 [Pseudomonas sp. SWRI50]|uniref:hypothetical protein n=1 Tax=Pseudomonas sp. SWRI50 TaxID=2745484 RepID=UPI0016484EF5|nr:hypothetical protein [Pseudomonas sp. SWRI50]MBC3486260.1 hypothetical protein [Pseudomonas sp. SWRI50]